MRWFFQKMGALEVEEKYPLLLVVCSFDYVNDGEKVPLSHVLVDLWIVGKVTTIVSLALDASENGWRLCAHIREQPSSRGLLLCTSVITSHV